MKNSDKFTSLAYAKNRVLGKVGTERRYDYERDRIKSLFNWGELSRMLAGTRAVVLKNKYPKKHDAFIQDLTESTRQVLIRHGHIQPDYKIDKNIGIGGHSKMPTIINADGGDEFYAESFTEPDAK